MTELMYRQIHEFFIMFFCGISIMLIFTVRNFLMNRYHRKRIKYSLYIGSWIIAGFLFWRFLYCSSYGRISMSGLISMLAGILLWKKLIYDIISSPMGCCYSKAGKRDTNDEKTNERKKRAES